MPAFVPDISVMAAFAVAAAVLAITPGPDMALFVARTINHGRAHGVAAVAGAVSGLMVHSFLAAFGISLLLIAAPPAFLALKIAGALYLLWLAIQAVRQEGGLRLARSGGRAPRLGESYLTGLGINLTNPKIVLFFVTFLPQFVASTDPHAAGKLLFLGAEFLAVAIPIVLVIVLLAERIARLLTRSRVARLTLNWSFAAVFAAFAVAILAVEGRR